MAEAAKVFQFPGEIGDCKIYVVHNGPEPEDHPAIQISISRQDSVHWTSYSQKFRVRELNLIRKGPGAVAKPPEHPFYREFPRDNPNYEVQINSGPAKPEAYDCTYEAHFDFEDGTQGDPHIQIGK
jgi:hypothetical protein